MDQGKGFIVKNSCFKVRQQSNDAWVELRKSRKFPGNKATITTLLYLNLIHVVEEVISCAALCSFGFFH